MLGVVISLTLLLESQLVPVKSAWETPYRPGLIGSARPGLQGSALNKERTLLSKFSLSRFFITPLSNKRVWAKGKCVETSGLHLHCVLMHTFEILPNWKNENSVTILCYFAHTMKVNAIQCCFRPHLLSLNGEKRLNHSPEYLVLCSSFTSNFKKCTKAPLEYEKVVHMASAKSSEVI